MSNMVDIIRHTFGSCWEYMLSSTKTLRNHFLHIVYDNIMSEYEADSIPFFNHVPLYFMKLETWLLTRGHMGKVH